MGDLHGRAQKERRVFFNFVLFLLLLLLLFEKTLGQNELKRVV